MSNTNERILKLKAQSKGLSIVETLIFLSDEFKDSICFSTSFGQEDQAIMDMIAKNNIPIEVFTLDTGRLFQENYDVFQLTKARYKKDIAVFFPEASTIQKLVNTKGPNSFYDSIENRKECCYIRKVVPLTKALAGKSLWITGLRAEQSESRHQLESFEYDAQHQLIKYHPLLDWTIEEVKNYAEINHVPQNQLHKKGYTSIGCAPCTRAIVAGEDTRAGRWWWEDSKKECGLHDNENTI